jgi:predicted N-formylglutamate amidohydrolase
MHREWSLLVTCEHAGNFIPAPYRPLFVGHEVLLNTHRAYDLGALPIADALSARFKAPLFASHVSRLVVDLNRSPRHRHLFSEITRALPSTDKTDLLARHYHMHRNRVSRAVSSAIESGQGILHLAVHTFTPVLDGIVRTAEVGLLYDPARPFERSLCRAWASSIKRRAPALRVRRNYPYRGVADGLTKWLRTRFPDPAYAGIELEINQAISTDKTRSIELISLLAVSLAEVLGTQAQDVQR